MPVIAKQALFVDISIVSVILSFGASTYLSTVISNMPLLVC